MTSIPSIPVQPAYVQKPTRYIAPHLATSTPYSYLFIVYYFVFLCVLCSLCCLCFFLC